MRDFLAFCLICIGVLGLLILASLLVVDKVLDKYRRKKYPGYFKIYDMAVKDSIEISDEFNRRYDNIKYCLKLYADGLHDGECMSDTFEPKMCELTKEYAELCQWHSVSAQYVRDLWKQLDDYAKEHNLKWGRIYDT